MSPLSPLLHLCILRLAACILSRALICMTRCVLTTTAVPALASPHTALAACFDLVSSLVCRLRLSLDACSLLAYATACHAPLLAACIASRCTAVGLARGQAGQSHLPSPLLAAPHCTLDTTQRLHQTNLRTDDAAIECECAGATPTADSRHEQQQQQRRLVCRLLLDCCWRRWRCLFLRCTNSPVRLGPSDAHARRTTITAEHTRSDRTATDGRRRHSHSCCRVVCSCFARSCRLSH